VVRNSLISKAFTRGINDGKTIADISYFVNNNLYSHKGHCPHN